MKDDMVGLAMVVVINAIVLFGGACDGSERARQVPVLMAASFAHAGACPNPLPSSMQACLCQLPRTSDGLALLGPWQSSCGIFWHMVAL